MSTLWI